jgi:hypothetical protein
LAPLVLLLFLLGRTNLAAAFEGAHRGGTLASERALRPLNSAGFVGLGARGLAAGGAVVAFVGGKCRHRGAAEKEEKQARTHRTIPWGIRID